MSLGNWSKATADTVKPGSRVRDRAYRAMIGTVVRVNDARAVVLWNVDARRGFTTSAAYRFSELEAEPG